jgi:hypothetical protein
MDTKNKWRLASYVMFFWVWMVSMIDHYLTIKLSATINQEERNPIGIFLLELDRGSPALFMTTKMICLWIIAILTYKIYQWRPHVAIVSLVSLSIVQLILIIFLFKF